MNSVKAQYIEAFLSSLKAEVSVAKAVKALESAMEKRGHQSLLPAVLKAALKELSGTTLRAGKRLVLAREEDNKLYAKLAEDAQIEIDPSLIGGYIKEENFNRVDNSYKARLLNWYRTAVR